MGETRDRIGEHGAGDDQVFARPQWLSEFADQRGVTADSHDPDHHDGGDRGTEGPEYWEPEPSGWRRSVDRIRTTPRTALALCLVGVVAVIVAAAAVLLSGDRPGNYPIVNFDAATQGSGQVSPAPAASGTNDPEPPGAAIPTEVVVAVVGLVRTPGLHRLPEGARIADCLAVAGGTLDGADTQSLNLAQVVRDGDQVVVGVADHTSGVRLQSSVTQSGGGSGPPAQSGSTAGGGSGGAAPSGSAVNINTADAAELDTLPGVGEVTAAAILAYRDENGPFGSVDDLANVNGIGEAKLAQIKPLATV